MGALVARGPRGRRAPRRPRSCRPTSSCVTSPDLLFRALRARDAATGAHAEAPTWILDAAFPAGRAARLVTVLDGHPHTLAFLASVHGARASHLGVTDFGRSSDLADAWAHHHLDADAIVAAALA